MGKKYTTDEIEVGGHMLDASMMSGLNTIVSAGSHTLAGYLTTYTDTTYSVGNGGLTEINFTSALNTKLAGITAGANNYVLPFTNNSANWNTAYGWGNHASKGYGTFSNDIYLNDSTTTDSFIAELTNEYGAFQDNYKVFKVSWNYAGNSDLNVGFETIELAGCLIECWGGVYKHIRVTRPTTGSGGRSIYVYNDQGSNYSPGWRQIWTSDEFNSTNITTWNTAYGWGNHAGLYAAASHSHSYLPLAGGTITGNLVIGGSLDVTDDWILVDNNRGLLNSGSWNRLQTPYGNIDFGPANVNHAHIYTDRSDFYFNKSLTVNGSSVVNTSDIRAKIFYDVDNTGYYLNPAGTSRLGYAHFDGYDETSGNARTSTGVSLGRYTSDFAHIDIASSNSNGGWIDFSSANGGDYKGRIRYHNGSDYMSFYVGGANEEFRINSTYTTSLGSSRAPIFYDSNNTAYYLDPASTSRLAMGHFDYIGAGTGAYTSGSYRLNMGGNIRMNNSGIDYISQLHFNANVRFYQDSNASYLNFKYGDATTGGIKFLNGSGTLKGYVFANAESFGLLDATGNWAVKTAVGAAPLTLYSNANPEFYVYDSYTYSPGSSRAPIFYDSNNTAYYLNPYGYSNLQGMQIGSGDLKMYENGTYSSELRFQNNTHHMGIDYQNNETLRFITRSGVTTVPITFQMRAGTITAANFILSSDERKKTKIVDLPCDNIDVSWKSFEMKDNEGEYRTGVIAQELEQKHPEFVNTDNEGFKSVKYIDLLIAKIAELEARLEKLEK